MESMGDGLDMPARKKKKKVERNVTRWLLDLKANRMLKLARVVQKEKVVGLVRN